MSSDDTRKGLIFRGVSMRAFILAFAVASAMSFSGFEVALAQPASQTQCTRYAQHAMTQYQRALEGSCDLARVRMSGNYDQHYRACLGWDKNRVNSEEVARASEYRMACERKVQRPPVAGFRPGGPPPPAPRGNDPSRHPVCQGFAQWADHWDRQAMRFGCRFKRAQNNETGYYRWCQGTTDASFRERSPTAAGHKAILEKVCSTQLRRPVRL